MREIKLTNIPDWFTVRELSDGVFAISEEKHEQKVSSFLIIGEDGAVLLDTGLGICNIKEVVDNIYEGDLTVINSHFHFDHIGNNWRFKEVHARLDEYSQRVSTQGIANSLIAAQVQEHCFAGGVPVGFDAGEYCIRPYSIVALEDGEVFDLGDRVLRVIYAPGHSQDSVVLYDETNGILFTGDFFYLGGLFVFFDDPVFGCSNLSDYAAAAKRILSECPDVNAIYPSHNDLVVPGAKLMQLSEALDAILDNNLTADIEINDIDPYTNEKIRLLRYNFDGFGVVLKA